MTERRPHAFRVNRHEIWTGFTDQPPHLGKHIATGTSDETTELIINTLNIAFYHMEIASKAAGTLQ